PHLRRLAAPLYVRVRRARAGETFAALAREDPTPGHDGGWLSYLNGYRGAPRPRPGDLVKVIAR
ncbi:MAG: peptidase M48 Ste24p, partial [Nitrospirae bacterium]